ncbi:MAG TPA: DUF2231 domain-containing protein [Geothrix sp.]|nr:DUF2231 domain-containing protein [Geothrix sp.]
MPAWSHIHPLVVHFPIALLATAPLLVLLGLFWPSQRSGIHFAALVLLVLGTLGALLAWASGEAAAQWAQRTPELRAVLPRHEQSGQITVLLFGGLTLLFALLWLWPLVRKRTVCDGRMLLLNLLWLLASLLGVASLVRTGQLGGHMVHDLGTHPIMAARPAGGG